MTLSEREVGRPKEVEETEEKIYTFNNLVDRERGRGNRKNPLKTYLNTKKK